MTSLTAAVAALALAQATAFPPTPTAGPILTLDDALRRGAEANLDLEAARARLERARAGIGRAWSFHLPQVTAGASCTCPSRPDFNTLPSRDEGIAQSCARKVWTATATSRGQSSGRK